MNTKILVVDDEPDIRVLLKDILEDEGYAVDVAEHARQANEIKARFVPDLVLLDIWMPDTDGVTLLKQWNEQNELTCPVVMMSGHGTVETAVEATRYGAYDFVEKPLSMAKLLRTVKSALSSGGPGRQLVDSADEQPVGNSQVMQNLRQIMHTHAHHLMPLFMVAQPGAGASIWANYLFSLQPQAAPRQTFQADLALYQQGIPSNVFISEVAELSMQGQRILLAVLQNPVSPTSSGRFVIASRYDYESLRDNHEVLPELAEYWRMAIAIPSLDERIEDIPELLEYYANRFHDRDGLPYRHFGVAAQNLIRNHPWHGGLNELKMFVRDVLQNSDDDNVDLAEIRQLLSGVAASAAVPESTETLDITIDLNWNMREAREYFEREFLKKQLELCRYNVSELARKVGQERTNLYRKLKALGLHTKK